MTYSVLMRQKRAEAIDGFRSILDAAAAERRDLTREEVQQVELFESDATKYTQQMEQAERADGWALEAAKFRGVPTGGAPPTTKPDTIRKLLMSALERGYAVADFPVYDTRALATSAQTVPTEFVNKLTVYERDAAPMLDGRFTTINNVNDGRNLIFPLLSADPAVGGTVTAEAAGITDADATLGAATATPFKFAVMQTWSNELQYDAFTDLEGALARSAGRELGADINVLLTTGDGSSKPEGFVTAATNGGTASGTAGAQSTDTFFSYFDLADLFYSLPAPLRERSSFMVASTAMSKIVKMRDGNGFPIVDQNPTAGTPRTLFGAPLIENADMAAAASATKSVACGDFSAYEVVRMPIRVEASIHSKFQNDQVQLRVIERVDGKLVDATAVRYLVSANT